MTLSDGEKSNDFAVRRLVSEHVALYCEVQKLNEEFLLIKDALRKKQKQLRKIKKDISQKSVSTPSLYVVASSDSDISSEQEQSRKSKVALACFQGGKC